jgi:transcriptional regulator with XRE-family HTH domain
MLDDRSHEATRAMLASNLRRMRIARHLSLSELAKAAEMSKATLSGIENARANPTVETLVSLASALGASLNELLEAAPLGEIHIVRASTLSGARDELPSRRLDAISSSGELEISELALAAYESREIEPRKSGARAHIYVLAGKLITGPLERCTELEPGDYVSFPADVAHVYQAGRNPARLFLLGYTPAP